MGIGRPDPAGLWPIGSHSCESLVFSSSPRGCPTPFARRGKLMGLNPHELRCFPSRFLTLRSRCFGHVSVSAIHELPPVCLASSRKKRVPRGISDQAFLRMQTPTNFNETPGHGQVNHDPMKIQNLLQTLTIQQLSLTRWRLRSTWSCAVSARYFKDLRLEPLRPSVGESLCPTGTGRCRHARRGARERGLNAETPSQVSYSVLNDHPDSSKSHTYIHSTQPHLTINQP